MKISSEMCSPQAVFAGVALAVAVLAAPAGYAQINKCVDPGGKVVGYASECPAGTRSQATAIRSSPSAAGSTAARSIAEQDAEFRKRQMEKQEAQAKADKRASEQEERTRACSSARSYLQTLQSGMRIARADPKTGERVYLGESEYRGEIAAAQRAVDANCK